MKNKYIIIILLIIIAILAVVIGAVLLQQEDVKQTTKLNITSDKTQYEGGKLKIQLTDLNKTAISKAKVNITIVNKKGNVVVNETLKTNSKGKAKLDLDFKKGKYTVNVTFGGNENYTGNNTTQKLTIKEEVKKTTSISSNTNDFPEYNPDLGYYRSTGINDMELGVVELADGRYVVIAGDGYYEYGGQDAQGNIILGSFLGHGGQRI